MVSIKLRRLRKPIYFLTNLIWANCGITLNMFTGEQTHNYHIIFQCYSSIDWLRKFHKAQMDKCGNGECHFIFLLSWIAPENAGNSYFGSPPQTFFRFMTQQITKSQLFAVGNSNTHSCHVAAHFNFAQSEHRKEGSMGYRRLSPASACSSFSPMEFSQAFLVAETKPKCFRHPSLVIILD